METIRLTATPSSGGARLDSFVAESVDGLSRSAAANLIESGAVLVDGRTVRKNHRLQGGEDITVTLPEPAESAAVAQDIPLDVIYEDDLLLVVNKPRGMVVHPAPGHPDGTLVNALLSHCAGQLSGIGGVIRPGIVHRIDRDTSGLLVVAKTDESHQALSAQLKARTLSRVYEAVVRGSLREDEGQIDAPIGRSDKNRKKMAVTPTGREARTDYTVLGRYNGYTHAQCRLHTGRTHQIRVHMASLGHPVAGDALYGGRGDRSGLEGQCLHARRIKFVHPRGGWEIELECPRPEYFEAFLEKIVRF